MVDFVLLLANVSVLVFVVTSMLGMGTSLTIQQILTPLSNKRLMIMALVANFILVPLLAFIIIQVIPMAEAYQIGLVLLATAAGAPFLPKLVQVAKGDAAFSVGLMVLLMVVTVVYVPVVLPLLMSGVEVNAWEIAKSLIIMMLVPLGIGLVIKARYAEIATMLQPIMNQASSFALILMSVLMLLLNLEAVLGTLGTGAILALILFIGGSFAIGYVMGGGIDTKPVMALGTGQRNIAAALVVGAQNFGDPDVIVMLMVGAILGLIVLMVAAGELGRQSGIGQKAA
ncbi:bile acid:sodium symporter family protein [Chloroflexota bacterium]